MRCYSLTEQQCLLVRTTVPMYCAMRHTARVTVLLCRKVADTFERGLLSESLQEEYARAGLVRRLLYFEEFLGRRGGQPKRCVGSPSSTRRERDVTRPATFPDYGPCESTGKLDNLVRLLQTDIFETQYMDGRAAAQLLAAGMTSYTKAADHPLWSDSNVLARVEPARRFMLFCAALFDLICNVEYVHKRVTNSKWIYCNRGRDGGEAEPFAYYSFLKQCPECCQDRGLDPRISGAQHKPSSHHIGEITTTAMALFLHLLGLAAEQPLQVGVISKQNHDVDAVAWRKDLIILFEMKASPMVTYPIRMALLEPMTESTSDGPAEVGQHKLIDVGLRHDDLELYLANKHVGIPLGKPDGQAWPYPQVSSYIGNAEGVLSYFEAWVEVFMAYSVPKRSRTGREVVMGYLANGWGDEIDSNKTKPGLGRTDDIKKGTYQLLKYGAYYRQGSPDVPIRGALVANLDPMFLYAAYMQKLIDARWAPAANFQPIEDGTDHLLIPEADLYFLYDAVLAFNQPVINDPLLSSCFDFMRFEQGLTTTLAKELDAWLSF